MFYLLSWLHPHQFLPNIVSHLTSTGYFHLRTLGYLKLSCSNDTKGASKNNFMIEKKNLHFSETEVFGTLISIIFSNTLCIYLFKQKIYYNILNRRSSIITSVVAFICKSLVTSFNKNISIKHVSNVYLHHNRPNFSNKQNIQLKQRSTRDV